MIKLMVVFLVAVMLFAACGKDDNVDSNDFGIFEVVDDSTLLMDGDIGSNTLKHFNNVIAQYPDIKTIKMKEVPGSTDDEINLQVALKVHREGISTHLLDNGLIASGGVDFFLAGVTRTKGSNTMIGVHSWSDEDNDATAYPVGHAYHQPYITFYQDVGFSQEDAEAFYYYTINAASADDIHYMTDTEIAQYHILKP